jgi:formylglycine-generating enzyme required for sulfatase activity
VRPSSALVLAIALAACRRDPPPPAVTSATAATTASAAPSGTAEPAAIDAGAIASTPEGMIAIPAGVFLMGSPGTRGSPEERPMHEVAVAAFYLDRTEVTVGAYLACLRAGKCTAPHDDNPFCNVGKSAPPDREGHPINCIDAVQAEAYCASVEKRLPTEREWEYAARGGAEERKYSWGEEEPTSARACYTHPGTCKVASFAPGAFGLYDMSGNVWEWTSTWFGDYPTPPEKGTHRVYRGGSWSRRFPKWLSTAMRNRYEPDRWSAALGVRCAKSRVPTVCPEDHEAKGGACARVRGTPKCEPTYAWNGEACTPGGAPSPKLGPPSAGADAAPSAEAAPREEQPITQARTPQHDADCQAHFAGKPAAYRFSGSTFHKRNRPIEAAGCTRRDMGETWTSVCCPQ